MGADYTIAVALDLPSNQADFESLLGVAGKSISFMIAEKSARKWRQPIWSSCPC